MINRLPMAIALPSTAGSLESYIQAVNRFPLLSEEEEVRLAHQYRDHEDLSAARELVLSHLRLVVSIARGYLGYGLPHADLIQEGNVGLMKAVKRFDPESRRAPGFVRGPLDPRRDARAHPAQLAHGQDRDDQGAAQAVLQSAQHEEGPWRHESRRRPMRWRASCG